MENLGCGRDVVGQRRRAERPVARDAPAPEFVLTLRKQRQEIFQRQVFPRQLVSRERQLGEANLAEAAAARDLKDPLVWADDTNAVPGFAIDEPPGCPRHA